MQRADAGRCRLQKNVMTLVHGKLHHFSELSIVEPQLAVGGQRYLVYQDACCRCCSWANGCGPVVPSWTVNATYSGPKQVNGQTCSSYLIQGFEPNHLLQRTNDSQLCELDNADEDYLVFDPHTCAPPPPNPSAQSSNRTHRVVTTAHNPAAGTPPRSCGCTT